MSTNRAGLYLVSVAAATGRAGEACQTGACHWAGTSSAGRKNCLQLFQSLQESTR